MDSTYRRRDILLRNILFILIINNIFNFSRGIPYLSLVSFFLSVFICLFYFTLLLSRNEITRFGWLMVFFMVLWLFAWAKSDKIVFQTSSNSYRNTTELLTPVIQFCLIYFPFYYFGNKRLIPDKFISYFIYLIFGIAFYKFLNSYQTVMSDYDEKFGNSINIGYLFACSMPLLGFFLNQSKRKFYIFMFLAFSLAMISAKRGAMLCAVASFIVMALIVNQRKKSFQSRLRSFLQILILLGVTALIFSQLIETNANLATKMEATEEGSYSGREVFYQTLLDHWLDASLIDKLFGIKFMGAVSVVGFDAHNDWLEILIDAGVVTTFFYFMLMINAWVFTYHNRLWLYPYEKYILLSGSVIWLIKSLVSMGFTVPEARFYIISFAIVCGTVMLRKKQARNINQ